MKRQLALVIIVLLIGGVIYLNRILSSDKVEIVATEEDNSYRLNASLCNAISDLPETESMEKYIKRWMARNNIRGASLAVMHDEHLIYCKGFGWADQEMEREAEVGDIYRIASASKLVTGVGIMKLCDQGKLSLDDKVFGEDGILKQFSDFKDKRVKDITVRHLLNHTAGLSRQRGDLMFRVTDVMEWIEMDTTPTADELIAFQLSLRLRCAPGGSAQYSNVGYLVLSRIIEQVSGMDYEEYLQTNVLWPAGCYDMHIAYNYYEQRYPGEVRYYGHDTEGIESYDGSGVLRPREYGGNNIRGLQGAGAWVASAVELMRLVASIDGKPGVPDIISAESVAEMRNITRKGDYALGWARYNESNGSLIRTGTMSGTSAYIDHRDNGISYVFLTNTSHYRGASFTNSIGTMVRNAMTRVENWPTDRDMFVEVPAIEKIEADSTATTDDNMS
ncbi:MAG: beta-lactamase family protein [Alistipes sp.]|nr:beta-lactamase family protein [Alistipes sp.]